MVSFKSLRYITVAGRAVFERAAVANKRQAWRLEGEMRRGMEEGCSWGRRREKSQGFCSHGKNSTRR